MILEGLRNFGGGGGGGGPPPPPRYTIEQYTFPVQLLSCPTKNGTWGTKHYTKEDERL